MENFPDLGAPWNAARVESYVEAARGLTRMFAEMRAERDSWLASRGLTLETARALPTEDRDALHRAWAARGAETAR